MENISFSSELISIKPERLINKFQRDKVENFFLVLGLFYNDLKNIAFHTIQTDNFFKNDDKTTISVNNGEYVGIKMHLERLTASTIYEFFEFLNNNYDILLTGEFNSIYNKLSQTLKLNWDVIVKIARKNEVEDESDLSRILMLIRNNITFHYYQTGKELRQGFVDFFYNDKKNLHNERALYTAGGSMNDTRFFYCDAAVTKSLINQIQKDDKLSVEQFNNKFKGVIKNINFTIMALMKIYIKGRPQK